MNRVGFAIDSSTARYGGGLVGGASQRLGLRSRIVLECASGSDNGAVAVRLGGVGPDGGMHELDPATRTFIAATWLRYFDGTS